MPMKLYVVGDQSKVPEEQNGAYPRGDAKVDSGEG